MKKGLFFIFAILIGLSGWAQSNTKLSPELQKELNDRTSNTEQFRVLITMADEYNQAQMTRQIQYMEKNERRAFVVNELQQFSRASQNNIMQVLEEGASHGLVRELTSFWISNSIGCTMTRDMLNSISQRNDILIIESDEYRNMLPEGETSTRVQNSISNSGSNSTATSRGLAWHITQVNADDVWNYNGASGYNGNGIIVAIVDTGVNYNHNDIKNNMWTNAQGYHGYDYVNSDNDPMDDNGHGSHCAGIVAGTGASGTQTGMAPGAKIMALKVLGANGSGSNANIMSAMQYAINNHADIISMSLGASGDTGNASERQLFVNMLNTGIIATLAAGNDGENYSSANPNNDGYYYSIPRNVGSPGNCPPPWHNPDQTLNGGTSAAVCVGSTNRNDRKSTFSSIGPVTWSDISGYNDYPYTAGSSTNIGLIRPDIAVPGSDITSLDYSGTNGYTEMCGTSMATPGCAGIFALMLSANPDLTPEQLDEIIETTAIPSDFQVKKNNNTGAGRADALAAIDAIFTTATKPTNLNLTTCGGNVILTWNASTAPAGYCIYRDNVQVASNVSGTTYTDENVGVGKHIYYVRANDGSNRQSVHSNCAVCLIEPYASVPQNLTGTLSNTSIDLNWQASTASNYPSQSTTLSFVSSVESAFGYSGGIRYLTEELGQYKGMSIDKISFYAYSTRVQHTLRIYRGTTYGNTTGTPVVTKTFTPSAQGWMDITLDTPYALDDVSQDLWVTVSASSGYPATLGSYDGPSSECCYLAFNSNANNFVWSHLPDFGADYNYALCIKTHLTHTTTYTPSYNIYRNDESLTQNLAGTNYNDASPNPTNSYYVTAKVGNNESCPSETIEVIVGGVEITATANPATGGVITGAGPHIEGSIATLTATPNLGYAFINWTENDQVVSTSATYSFTVSQPRTLTANFISIPQNNIVYANIANGSVSGPSAAYPGETVVMTATPANGYVLDSWNVYKTGDPNVAIAVENGQFVMPEFDVTVSAAFSLIPIYNINLACGIANGSINASHPYAEAGTAITLSATPSEGYSFYAWVITKSEDPETIVPITGNSFTMPSYDVDVTGIFSASGSSNTRYEKITQAPSSWEGEYLIVYEDGSKAFDGNLTTLDASGNYIDVSISENTIASNPTNDAATFTITRSGSGYTIQSKSGYYIGATSNTNSLLSSTSVAYTNTINYSNNAVNIVGSGGAYMRYNTQGSRFRYYKSSTYTQQQAIQLYKKTTSSNGETGSSCIAVAPCETEDFRYAKGYGPSEAQSITAVSSFLDQEIAVVAPTHYEISNSINGTYGSSLSIPVSTPQTSSSTFSFDNDFDGWTTLDQDEDGFNWFHVSEYEAHCIQNKPNSQSGEGCLISMSYDNCNPTPINPENYLVSPEIPLGGSLSFYAAEANTTYGAEVLGIFVSTAANPTHFTKVGNDISIASTSYRNYTVDLSAYSGMGHVAICHYNCSDVFFVMIDEITISHPANANPNLPAGVDVSSIFVRLKAGLPEGQYNGETLTFTSGDASAAITLNGEVTDVLHIVSDSQTINGDLIISESNRYQITSTGILTVNGNLTCDNPSQLVIEDGGQLFCNSTNVQATFHKIIEKTTNDSNAWYTIASPMSNPTIQNLTSNTFDIYAYDEDAYQEEWQNYRVNSFDFEPGHGYLYANSAAAGEENTDLIMTGILTPSNTSVTVSLSYGSTYEGVRGYNLIGNPYSHNISMNDVKVNGTAITEFYRLSNGSQLERFTSGEILPGESFFIKATAPNQSVVIGGE